VYVVYYNIATIGIGIFQFHKEILNNLVFWIIFYFFLLTIFSYMLYDSKWSENFQEYSQLSLKNESIEFQPFWNFFYNDLTLWNVAARIFAVAKKWFLLFQMLIPCNLHTWWKLLNFFFTSSQRNVLQDPTEPYMCPKMFLLKKFFFS